MSLILQEEVSRPIDPKFQCLHHGPSVVVDQFVSSGHIGGPWDSTEHWHSAIQATFIPAGSVAHARWISDSGSKSVKRVAGPGVCITPATQPHSMEWDQAYGTLMMLINISLLDCESTRTNLAWTGEGIYGKRDAFLEHLGALLVDTSQSGLPLSRLHVESTAVLILRHLNKDQSFSLRPSNEQARLERVREFIHANLAEDLSIIALARIAQTSPFHFGRLFKESFGLTPHRYVLQERIEMAKSLLKDGQAGIAEIAYQCGFASHAHLAAAFHLHVGTTPRQFRHCLSSKTRFDQQVSKKNSRISEDRSEI